MGHLTIIQKFAIWVLPVLFAITVHEVAHGWVASKLGDKTALMLGRLTLNPLKHIDPIGTIIVPAILLYLGGFIFGWARPVPVTYSNLRNPKRDMALVAAAGPIANLIMAAIWAAVAKIGVILLQQNIGWALAVVLMGQAGILINLVLMVLNLIPIPPLDGSRIVSAFLPDKVGYVYNRIAPYGIFILLFLLATRILGFLIGPPVMLLFRFIITVIGL